MRLKQESLKKNRPSDKNLAVGFAVLALAGGTKFGIDRLKAGNELNAAQIQMSAANTPKRAVEISPENTLFAIASEAVNDGYLKVDKREASDFLVSQLNDQMHAKGLIKVGEKLDVGEIPSGTVLEVPASWDRIGAPIPTEGDSISDIGTAITASVDPATGKMTVNDSK